MRILITGANGFIGENLRLHLSERRDIIAVPFTRKNRNSELHSLLCDVDFVIHLAGVNRPKDPNDFVMGNIDFTRDLCDAITTSGKKIPVIYTSSIQAIQDNLYGISKRKAEDLIFQLQYVSNNSVYIFRLPNVFGKWCKPNYNSVVATFCHNIAHDLPIKINDPTAILQLAYIDDVINQIMQIVDGASSVLVANGFNVLHSQYETTVGELAQQILSFKNSRINLITERVGVGLVRALYSTYLSYLPKEKFSYQIPVFQDQRGVFSEIIKTKDSGQFSFFTAGPGVTRGNHYHHTKSEKFLVVKGAARFAFCNILTNETHDLTVSDQEYRVIESIPGWAHNITNIGDEEMVVLLWANEIFEAITPDTHHSHLNLK